MEDISKPDSKHLDLETSERVRKGIQRIRRGRALSLKELAAKVGLSESFTCRLLTGNRTLSFANVKRFCQALKVPLSSVISPSEDDGLLYDKKLTLLENRELERMLWEIRKGLVAYLIKNRRKKPALPDQHGFGDPGK